MSYFDDECDRAASLSMLQCSAQIRILFIDANFVADNASHELASSATVRPILNVELEVVVIGLQRRLFMQ